MDATAAEAAPEEWSMSVCLKVRRGLSFLIDDVAGSGGCGFDVCWICRRINAAAMFRYGGRGGEREGLGKFRWPVLEVRLRGLKFFFRGFPELYM